MSRQTSEMAFDQEALRQFRGRIPQLLFNMGFNYSLASSITEEIVSSFESCGVKAFGTIGKLLKDAGVQQRWNSVLAIDRSKMLAAWLTPYLKGSVLDLLCGEGLVGLELRKRAHSVTLVERAEHFIMASPALASEIIEYRMFSTEAPSDSFDTSVLCTVLHHEIEPETLFDCATRVSTSRIIIIENCIDDEYSASYHQLMDLFFNHCLNYTALNSPGRHRRPESWQMLMSTYGRVKIERHNSEVPGIPLCHYLIVADREEV